MENEIFLTYLNENKSSTVMVCEGTHTKSLVFKEAFLVQTKEITLVRVRNHAWETHRDFYDSIFKILQDSPRLS